MEEEINQNSYNSYQEQPEQQPQPTRNRLLIILIVILSLILITLLVIAYIYFFIISPSFIEKPNITRPGLNTGLLNASNNSFIEIITAEHIIYLLNELEAYKLHDTLSGDAPRLEFILSDNNKVFFFTVQGNNIVEKTSQSNPDIRLTLNQETAISIYQSSNSKNAVLESYNNGRLNLEVLADTTTLVLKGYKPIADYFGITGFSLFAF